MHKNLLLCLILFQVPSVYCAESIKGGIQYDDGYKIQNILPPINREFIDLNYTINYKPLSLLGAGDAVKKIKPYKKQTIGYKNPPESYEISLATGHISSGGKSSADIEKMLNQNPNDTELFFAYAIQLKNEGNLNKALEIADSAIKIDPDFALAHFLKGDILRKMEKFKEATEEYIYTTQINPYCSDAYYNIAKILELLDNRELALEYYKTAYQANTTDNEIRDIILDYYIDL